MQEMAIQQRTDEEAIPAILVGMRFAADAKFDKSMREMCALAESCGMEVKETLTQPGGAVNSATCIGSGKVMEVQQAIAVWNAEVVLFNNILSPKQIKNLSDAFDLPVLDRTGLILRIFAERAQTREARLQVEYAQLAYALPRLAGLHRELGRQAGTSGAMSNRGAGETQIELDRRRIEHCMTMLRRELEEVSQERETQRARRQSAGIPRVALVGYTNAGKSTIMNRMLEVSQGVEKRKVLEQDRLFATLDTTVRRIEPGRDVRPFLLSDTVGFIDALPTALVKAFRSTLEEIRYADLLLIVSDCSDSEYRENLDVTIHTLGEIGAGEVPRIYVFNKCDIAGITPGDSLSEEAKGLRMPGHGPDDLAITMSAKNPEHIYRLIDLTETAINRGRRVCTLLIPFSEGKILAALKACCDLEILEYTETGTLVRGALRPEDAGRYAAYLR